MTSGQTAVAAVGLAGQGIGRLVVTLLHRVVLTATHQGSSLWLLEHAEGASEYVTGLSDVLDVVGLYGPRYMVEVN